MSIITKNLDIAIQILNQNDVVAIPTETVYGLAANAFNEEAVKKIFEIKKRPLFNPLIVHIKSKEYLNQVAQNIPTKAFQLIEAFWPGPLTLILDKQNHIPDTVTANKNTVAVRMPNHPIALALLAKLDFPLAAPSANPFKGISSTNAAHVYAYFKYDLKCILDGGDCEKGLESTIIGFDGEIPILYRHGAVAIEDIEKVVGPLKIITHQENLPAAPGMLLKHYSPKTRLILTKDIITAAAQNAHLKVAVLAFYPKDAKYSSNHHFLTQKDSLEEAASNLYTKLHELDALNLDLIIAEMLPNIGLVKTINDRLTRASAQ
jgi:L-threonylcarbamoyladenylate synthase